jgi:hypothetical protein
MPGLLAELAWRLPGFGDSSGEEILKAPAEHGRAWPFLLVLPRSEMMRAIQVSIQLFQEQSTLQARYCIGASNRLRQPGILSTGLELRGW